MHCISRLEQVRLLCSLVYLNFVRVNSLVVFALCFNRYFFVFFLFCFHVCLHQNPCHIGEVHGFIRVFPLAVKRPLNTVTLPVTDRLKLRIKLDFSTLLTTSLYSWILATHLSFDCLAEGIVWSIWCSDCCYMRHEQYGDEDTSDVVYIDVCVKPRVLFREYLHYGFQFLSA